MLLGAVLLISACSDSGKSRYFPLQTGLNWEYSLYSKTMLFESHAKYIVDNIGPAMYGDLRTIAQKVQGGDMYYYRREADGIHRIGIRRVEGSTLKDSKRDLLVLPEPPDVGRSWSQNSVTGVLQTEVDPFRRIYTLRAEVPMTFRIESADDVVRVPAGRFEHCLKIHGTGSVEVRPDKTIGQLTVHVDHTDWYAPGVGLVKTVRHESSDNKLLAKGEYILELVRFARD